MRRFSSRRPRVLHRRARHPARALPGHSGHHDFMAHTCPNMDLWRWAREWTSFQRPLPDRDEAAELRRAGLRCGSDPVPGRRAPVDLMEHSTSGVNWRIATSPGPREMAPQFAVAPGTRADGVMFFQCGPEEGRREVPLGDGPHAGPDSRSSVRCASWERHSGPRSCADHGAADIAILYDWESQWLRTCRGDRRWTWAIASRQSRNACGGTIMLSISSTPKPT